MCGRTACTLLADDVRKCCTYVNQRGKEVVPQWHNEHLYRSSYNLGPTKHSPVLMSNKLVNNRHKAENDRILQSMAWGLHVNGFGSKPVQVINARCETLLEKNTFKTPLKAGKRCVVLADGYFEWFRSGKIKEPYFIHLPQENGFEVHGQWTMEENESKRPKLLAMAGIYEKLKGDDEKYGYVVITVPASKKVSNIHDRMPAILETEDAIRNWLDSENINAQTAIDQLKPIEELKFYRVSTCVNNVRNNTLECIKPFIEPDVKTKATLLDNWLKRPAKTESSNKPCKNFKSE